MVDFTQYRGYGNRFYAGEPDSVTEVGLRWNLQYDCTLIVCMADDGQIIAIMNAGKSEWTTTINPEHFLSDVNDALNDACDLGRRNDIPDRDYC